MNLAVSWLLEVNCATWRRWAEQRTDATGSVLDLIYTTSTGTAESRANSLRFHQRTWALQEGGLYWVGRAPRGVRGQVTPRGETEDRGRHDRLDGVDRAELGAVGWDWTWETCRGQQRDSVTGKQWSRSRSRPTLPSPSS